MANFYSGDGDDGVVGGFVDYYGGGGNDYLVGDANPNELYGGQGNDVLLGGIVTGSTGTGTTPADPKVPTAFARPETTISRAAAAATSPMALTEMT